MRCSGLAGVRLRWRTPGRRPRRRSEETDFYFGGIITFDGRAGRGVTHHGRGQRLRGRDRSPTPRAVAPVRAREGRLRPHARRGHPPRRRHRGRGRARSRRRSRVRADRHEDRQPLPRRGRARDDVASSTSSLERLINGLNFGLLLALAAMGASLIFGTTGLSNFAHGEMVTFGALIALVFGVISGPGRCGS